MMEIGLGFMIVFLVGEKVYFLSSLLVWLSFFSVFVLL